MEGVSIWRTRLTTSGGMYNSEPPELIPPITFCEPHPHNPVVLPDDPPTWPALSTPPHSPATLGFVANCINPNLGSQPPVSVSQALHFTNPTCSGYAIGIPISAGISSGSFTAVPPLTGIPSSSGYLGPSTLPPLSPPQHISSPPPERPRRASRPYQLGTVIILAFRACPCITEEMDSAI